MWYCFVAQKGCKVQQFVCDLLDTSSDPSKALMGPVDSLPYNLGPASVVIMNVQPEPPDAAIIVLRSLI